MHVFFLLLSILGTWFISQESRTINSQVDDAFKSRPKLTHTKRLESAGRLSIRAGGGIVWIRIVHPHTWKKVVHGWLVRPISDIIRRLSRRQSPFLYISRCLPSPTLVSPYPLPYWSIKWVRWFVSFEFVLLLLQEWMFVHSLGRWVLSKGNRYACPTSTQPPESSASFCTLYVINRRTCLGFLLMLLLSLDIALFQ